MPVACEDSAGVSPLELIMIAITGSGPLWMLDPSGTVFCSGGLSVKAASRPPLLGRASIAGAGLHICRMPGEQVHMLG